MRATRKIVRNKRGSTRRRRRSGEATRKLSLFKKKQQQLKEELNKHDIKLTKKQHTKYAKLLVKMSVIAVSGMIIAREMTIGEASRKRHDNIMADLDQNIAYYQLCRKIIKNQISPPTSALKQLLQFIKTPADKRTIRAHINANPSRIGPAYRDKKLSVLIPYPAQNKYVEIWFTEEKDGDRIYLTVQEEAHAYYQRSSNNNDEDTDAKIKECYDILNVKQGVDNKRAITVSYHKLALKHHPDKVGGDGETFKKITYAYEQLLHHIENK